MMKIRNDLIDDLIPDVIEDAFYNAQQIEESEYVGTTSGDHVVIKLSNGDLAVVYSIDLE
jgi:hypothetical protein